MIPGIFARTESTSASVLYGLNEKRIDGIAAALEDSGHTPIILDSLITGRREFTRGRIFYEVDIADRAALQTIFREHPDVLRSYQSRFTWWADVMRAASDAGVLVLEEYEHAKARGARILAEVVGYGNTCDAYHITAPHPEAEGSSRMIQLAFEEAGFAPDEYLYINPHGTSTPMNDKIETFAIKAALGDVAYKIPISSTKSMTGHMLGAAGGVEAIVAVKALQNNMVPPTLGYKEHDADCDLDYVPNTARSCELDAAMSLSLGFGGHNAGIVFKKE